MFQTFRAILRGNLLHWGDEVKPLSRDEIGVQVLVTILEDEPIPEATGRGKRMAAVLEKLAQTQAFTEIDPVAWQRDVRQDRELPGRDK
ncbi:hypothetical protein [Calothrix sp. 336/3]|uniref:hypothetical protein n=1 Tax=Calothrix sp. 336/3 TaxID=1337936 RepID=UPI0004E43889|nr:hypothetical protein [Calothrix sp. 336/3]AKG24290.1 hypothetical protein IJ00_25880 [Calothrix sp. 336/3]